MTAVTDALANLLETVRNGGIAYFGALVGLSAITMALIQVWKTQFHGRRHFNERRLVVWVAQHVKQANTKEARNSKTKERLTQCDVLDELLRLAADGDASALYDAELGDLCAQWLAAAQLVVDYPGESEALFRVMTVTASENDVALLLGPTENANTQPQDRRRLLDAKTRVRAAVARAVGAFQFSTSAFWQRALQAWSYVVSASLAGIALSMSENLRLHPATVAFSAVLAGFLAPVARDMVAALEKLRA